MNHMSHVNTNLTIGDCTVLGRGDTRTPSRARNESGEFDRRHAIVSNPELAG